MPTRNETLLAPVLKDGRLIEIGPSHNPIAPKSAGWNTAILDHATKDELVAKYTGHSVDLARIEEVDFIWHGGPLEGAVPADQHGTFDAFIASHVIEHTPDMIAFLNSAEVLLKPSGVVVLAVPDKRYCFDYFQPLTTTGQLLEAHADLRSRHTSRLAFDYYAYVVNDGGGGAWGQHPSRGLSFVHTLTEAQSAFSRFGTSPDYVDLHAWRFTPASFELLLLELARLGETDWQVDRITPAEGCEFLTWLRRGGRQRAAQLSEAELDSRRLALLKRSMLEIRAQIDWLLAGEPALFTGPLRPLPLPA